MKIQGDHIEAMDSATERRSQPLNVVDISRPSSPTEDGVVLTESIIVDDVPVERLVESVELAEEQVQIAHIVDDADAQDKYIERFANEEVISTDRKQILGHDQEKPLQNVRASTATSRRYATRYSSANCLIRASFLNFRVSFLQLFSMAFKVFSDRNYQVRNDIVL